MSDIKLFNQKQIRSVWNEEEEQWYFSVQDVVEILTDSTDVRQYIKRLRQRDVSLNFNWGTICTPVEMIAADGKKRKIQAANVKGLLRIIQSIPSPKAEPFKQWLAQVGYLTAEISKATFGLTPSEYKKLKGLEKKNQNLRDHMTDLELIFTMLGEKVTTEISKNEKPDTFEENRRVAKRGGKVAGNARKETEKELGRSVVSPQNFLENTGVIPEESGEERKNTES